MERKGYLTNILGTPIYRKIISYQFVQHYTTKIGFITDDNKVFLDGFSSTDRDYIREWLYRYTNKDVDVYSFNPRRQSYALPIIWYREKDEWLITPMSADVIAESIMYETYPYEKRLLREFKLRLDDIVVRFPNHEVVLHDYVNDWSSDEGIPLMNNYLEYSGLKPQSTVVIHDFVKKYKKHRIDVFGKYSVYTTPEKVRLGFYYDGYQPLFLTRTEWLRESQIIPTEFLTEHIDAWRCRTLSRPTESPTWFKLVNDFWVGLGSETAQEMKQFVDDLIEWNKETRLFNGILLNLNYSSNIFVVYLDIYLKLNLERLKDKKIWKKIGMTKKKIEEIDKLATKEIIENVFSFLRRD